MADAAMDQAWQIQSLIGLLWITWDAYGRYTQPADDAAVGLAGIDRGSELAPHYRQSLIRSSTTCYRFWVTASIYIGLHVLVYVAVVIDPTLITLLQQQHELLGGEVMTSLSQSTPLLAAFLLTTLIPRAFARIERSLRGYLQRLGAIPSEVFRLVNRMENDDASDDPPELTAAITRRFAELGIPLPAAGETQGPAARLRQVLLLTYGVERWTTDATFASYVARHAILVGKLRQQRDAAERLAAVVLGNGGTQSTVLRTIGEHAPELVADGASPGLQVELARHHDELAQLCERELRRLQLMLAEFVARGLLSQLGREQARDDALRALGFSGVPDPRGASADRITLIVLALGLPFSVMLYAAGRMGGDATSVAALTKIAMITTIMCTAVYSAIYVKQVGAHKPPRSAIDRPWMHYCYAGLLAVVCGSILSWSHKMLMLRDAGRALAAYADAAPWFVVVFAIAVGTAFVLDDDHEALGLPRRRMVALEVLGMVLLVIAANASAWVLLGDIGADRPPLAAILASSPLIGLLLGWVVPWIYRRGDALISVPEADPVASPA